MGYYEISYNCSLIINLHYHTMKKVTLSLLIILFVGPALFAQEDKNNIIKMNIFGLFVGQSQLSYERAINENFSAQLSLGYISRNQDLSIGTAGMEYKTTGFLVVPEVRYYFTDVINGLYGAAFLRYRSTELKVENQDKEGYRQDRDTYGGGLLFGYQVLLGDADIVALDFFLGPQYKKVDQSGKVYTNEDSSEFENEDELKIEKDGIGVRLGINIGIAF